MKKEVRFRKQWTPGYNGSPYQNEPGLSNTEPDMNMSIRELMERHTRGVEVGVAAKTEYYEDDIGGEVPRHDDFTDIQEAKEELQRKAKELEEKMKRDRQARVEAVKKQQQEKQEQKKPVEEKENPE